MKQHLQKDHFIEAKVTGEENLADAEIKRSTKYLFHVELL